MEIWKKNNYKTHKKMISQDEDVLNHHIAENINLIEDSAEMHCGRNKNNGNEVNQNASVNKMEFSFSPYDNYF